MATQPAKAEPDRSRPPFPNPEVELIARLSEELDAFGPITRGQVARTVDRVVDAALASGLSGEARKRALSWARGQAEEAEKAARRAADAEQPTAGEPPAPDDDQPGDPLQLGD